MTSTPAQPQPKWIKNSNLRFFKTVDPSMVVPQVVSLVDDTIIKTLRDQFEVISRDVFYVTVISRRALAEQVSQKIYKEEEVLKAEQQVFKAFDGALTYFETRIKQAGQVLKEAGMEHLIDMSGTTPSVFMAHATSRPATRWLDLLRKADVYLALNHRLWVIGELGPSNWTESEALAAKLNNVREARATLTQLARNVNSQFRAIRELVLKVVEERRKVEEVKRQAQSERDRKASQLAKEALNSADSSATAMMLNADVTDGQGTAEAPVLESTTT